MAASDSLNTVQCSKATWGVCSLISRLRVLSILIKKLNKTLHKYYRGKKIFSFLELIGHVLLISEYILEKY